MIIYGINPVLEACAPGACSELRVGERGGDRLRELLALARERGVRGAAGAARGARSRRRSGGVHQGVVADVDEAAATTASRTWCAAPPARR